MLDNNQLHNDLEHHSASSDCDKTPRSTMNVHFPWKVHTMLTHSKHDGFEHIVSWLADGCSFKVHNQDEFVTDILPLFFNQTKYKSFQRQLNLWGFKRVIDGIDKGACKYTAESLYELRFFCPASSSKSHSSTSSSWSSPDTHKYLVEGRISLCKKITRQQEKPKRHKRILRDGMDLHCGRQHGRAPPSSFIEEYFPSSMSCFDTDFDRPTNYCVYSTDKPTLGFMPHYHRSQSSLTMFRESTSTMMPITTFRPSYGDNFRYVSMVDAEDFVLLNHRTSADLPDNHVHNYAVHEISSQVSDDTSINSFEGRHFYEVNETLGDKILAREIATNSIIPP